MNNEWTELSLIEAVDRIKKQEITPVELLEVYLQRIEVFNPRLNCFITITADDAHQAARNLDRILAGASASGPLCGAPLALKDLYETKGIRTTAGARAFWDYYPEKDAAVVEKLRAAGALLLGKLNMHEIALGVTNISPHFGPCHNPWALERMTGGSSGGSAAALAAGLCLGSFGSDTGGSIRIPASLCGIVGLKPTYGRISLRGVMPLSWNLDHPGPMARCVKDAALLLQITAGYDPADPTSQSVAVDDYLTHIGKGVRDWRIALADDEYFQDVQPQVAQAVVEAARVFEELGAQVKRVSFPDAQRAARTNPEILLCDAAALHRQRLETDPEVFGADILTRLKMGMATKGMDYAQARRNQALFRRQFELFFADYDVLLTPTTAITAPLIEGQDALEQARSLTRFTALFNLTGLPALSLPCGFSTDGLPIGLQLVGAPWSEARLLQAAYAYETATPWHKRRPDLAE